MDIELLQSDPTWSLYDLTTNDISMPVPGPTHSTLSLFVMQSPFHKAGLVGLYYVPALDITVGIGSGLDPTEVGQLLIEQDHFVTFADFHAFAGYAMVGTPQGNGVTAWEIDPAATQICEGHLRLEGVRSAGLASLSDDDATPMERLAGEWSVPGCEPCPVRAVLNRQSGRMCLKFPDRGTVGSEFFRGPLRLSRVEATDSALTFVDGRRETLLRMLPDAKLGGWAGELSRCDPSTSVGVVGSMILIPATERGWGRGNAFAASK